MFGQLFDFRLDRGLADVEGTVHRDVSLRVPDGRTEETLASASGIHMRALTSHDLIADRIAKLGGYAAPSSDLVAVLSVTDRARIVLELRRAVLGDRLLLGTVCTNPACGTEVDLDITVSELLAATGTETPQTIAVPLEDGREISVRPVLGTDDPEAKDIWPDLAENDPAWADLSPEDRQHAALALMRAEGGPQLGIAVRCPDCHLPIEIELDPLELLSREMSLGARRLLAEIHCLAFHYGWSEDAILDLPRARRWRYLSLITEQLTGGSLATDWG
ncbi:MAG: hypothetical protein AAGK37_11065 [Pseudomonadota bacterium]